MEKRYIDANELLIDSFELAKKIYESGFKPAFIIGVWRGGTPTGIAVQEYFDYLGVQTDHIAIRTSSYTDIGQQNKQVAVLGLDYVIDNIESEHELLIIDDVFDSGRSIQAILAALKRRCRKNMPERVKIACPWYKPKRNVTQIKPDFYLHSTDSWLVFPHELKGLTAEEIIRGKGQIIANTLPHSDQ